MRLQSGQSNPNSAEPDSGACLNLLMRRCLILLVATTLLLSGRLVSAAGPVELTAGASQIASGRDHSCLLMAAAGDAYCWGSNEYGQLGDNSILDRLYPTAGAGGMIGLRAIATGAAHTCVITATGGVKCWGNNGKGQLGDGNPTALPVVAPVDVLNLAGVTVQALALGFEHSCALTTAGKVKCWGDNSQGQIGTGNMAALVYLTPQDVLQLPGGIQRIAAGYSHNCALAGDGTARCWGRNGEGQIGDGTNITRYLPQSIGTGLTFSSLSAGGSSTCAIAGGRNAFCWGRVPEFLSSSSPSLVTQVQGIAKSISAGEGHICATTALAGVKCWGNNWLGQLGDGSRTQRPVTDVAGLPSSMVVSVALGGKHTCALTEAGGVVCWGSNVGGQIQCNGSPPAGIACDTEPNSAGQLGSNQPIMSATPTVLAANLGPIAGISAGRWNTCAISSAGALKCWGQNFLAQLGDGTLLDSPAAADVFGQPPEATFVSTGWTASCAVIGMAGSVKCWGSGFPISDGATFVNSLVPVQISGGLSAREVAVGEHHACALTVKGAVQCWGQNDSGQLGNADFVPQPAPVIVAGLGGVRSIVAGNFHTCALLNTGVVKCWGYNLYGQLGINSMLSTPLPTQVVGLTDVTRLVAGGYHTCAISSPPGLPAKTWCWGRNADGQLGDNSGAAQQIVPVVVLGLRAPLVTLAAGQAHTCGESVDRYLVCWGDNQYGQIGDGTTTDRRVPTIIKSPMPLIGPIAAGHNHTCARSGLSEEAVCWGLNAFGQLGGGEVWGYRTTPQYVVK